jgi:hypothetical protein
MKRSLSTGRILALPILVGTLFVGVSTIGGAGALTPPDPTVVQTGHIDICHRTNSNANPYVANAPDVEGVLDGHAGHIGDGTQTEPVPGPVWNPTLKADHIKWGDIIPPFKYGPNPEDFFDGLNWTSLGQDIYKNDCDPELPPPEEFGTLTITKVVVNPDSPDVPEDGYTFHVACDDKERDDIVIAKGGNVGTPVEITDIEAGSTCVITEVDAPPGVSYDPPEAATTGVVVDDEETVAVTVTNTFTNPTPPTPGGVNVAPAVAVQPSFTG